MNSKILTTLVLFLIQSCCIFKSGEYVWKWTNDKSNYDHYLDHQNKKNNLVCSWSIQKDEFYIDEYRNAQFKVKNISKYDTIIIDNPNFNEILIRNENGEKINSEMHRPGGDYVIIVDQCGRQIRNVYIPNLRLSPGDSIFFSFAFDKFGYPFLHTGVGLPVEEFNILPLTLSPGCYKIHFKYTHLEFRSDENPNYTFIEVPVDSFLILPITPELAVEHNELLEICRIHFFSARDSLLSECEKYIQKYPNSIYSSNVKRYISKINQ
jgi:hypothetical protein